MGIEILEKVTYGEMDEIKAVAESTGELHEGVSQERGPLSIAISQREQEERSEKQIRLRIAETNGGRSGATEDVKRKSGNAEKP